MIKTKVIETVEKYDKDGKLIEKITREETSEDNEMRSYGTFSNIAHCCGKKSENTNYTYC